jgi:hypothetical protein
MSLIRSQEERGRFDCLLSASFHREHVQGSLITVDGCPGQEAIISETQRYAVSGQCSRADSLIRSSLREGFVYNKRHRFTRECHLEHDRLLRDLSQGIRLPNNDETVLEQRSCSDGAWPRTRKAKILDQQRAIVFHPN